LERAAAADLAPVPVYGGPQRGILIARWVDGGVEPWMCAAIEYREMAGSCAGSTRCRWPAPARLMSPQNG